MTWPVVVITSVAIISWSALIGLAMFGPPRSERRRPRAQSPTWITSTTTTKPEPPAPEDWP